MNSFSTTLFKVTIVHEDTVTGLQATEVLKRLAAQLSGRLGMEISPWEFDNHVWKFDWLNEPEVFQEAVSTSVEADMIIISARAEDELPINIRSWIESVLPRKEGDCSALVAVLTRNENASTTALAPARYLRQLAQTHGVDFFCNLDDHPQHVQSGLEAVLSRFSQQPALS